MRSRLTELFEKCERANSKGVSYCINLTDRACPAHLIKRGYECENCVVDERKNLHQLLKKLKGVIRV